MRCVPNIHLDRDQLFCDEGERQSGSSCGGLRKVVIDEIIPIAGPQTKRCQPTSRSLAVHMGRFLHEVIEAIEFHDIASMTQEDWADDDAVPKLFKSP